MFHVVLRHDKEENNIAVHFNNPQFMSSNEMPAQNILTVYFSSVLT